MTEQEAEDSSELKALREWARSQNIDRSQKTRPLADVIAEARARAALLTDGAKPDKAKVRTSR